MKTKWKEKEKKEEKKGSEEKKVYRLEFELGTFDAPGQSFTTRPRGTHRKNRRNFIIKTFKPY